MFFEPEFLLVEDVLEYHEASLARFGGTAGVRDLGALEAAVMHPQASFDGEYLYPDLFAMAAAYGFHVAEAQAFLDGNKRTAVLAMIAFLALNGVRIRGHGLVLADAMIGISQRHLDKRGLADLLRSLAP